MIKASCAIGGIAISDFSFGCDESDYLCKRIKLALLDAITISYENGVREYFITCNYGVDIWAGEIVVDVR